jgi:hypothetical protein
MLNAIRNYEYIRMLRNDFVNAIRNYEYIRMLRTIYIYAMRIPLNIMLNYEWCEYCEYR